MASELQRQLGDVQPESSAGEEDHLEPEPEELESEEGAPGNGGEPEDDSEDPKEQPKGRTAENVYREMSRKYDTLQERYERVLSLLESRQQEQPKPDESDDPLASKSIAQLKALRGQVPEENQAAFEEYIRNREVEELVNSKVQEREQKTRFTTMREASAQEAVNLYPDLSDHTSDFAQKVDQELRRLGRQYVDSNPQAVLDAANRVALRTNHTPAVRRTRVPGLPATKRNAAPVKGTKKEPKQSVEEASKIARNLQRALPKGSKFDVEEMRKRTDEYFDNKDLFVRR